MPRFSMPCLSLLLYFTVSLASVGCGAREPGMEGQQDSSGTVPITFLLVVNKSGNSLSVVDPGDQRVIKTLPTGLAPHEVAASPDGRFAYVTDYGTGARPGSTVTVFDLETLSVARTLSLFPHTRPHGVVVAPGGSVWVTTEGSAHVLQVDPISGEILKAVETGQDVTHMVALAPQTGRVVTANIGSGTATIIDAETGRVLSQVATGAGAEGLDIHPDGHRAYVTNREAGTLVEVDLMTGTVTRSLAVGAFPIRAKVRPGGTEVLVSNANGNEIVAVDLESWGVVRHLPVGAMPVGILITPDGQKAFVANTQDDRLTVVDLEGWEVRGELLTGDEPDGMAWAGS